MNALLFTISISFNNPDEEPETDRINTIRMRKQNIYTAPEQNQDFWKHVTKLNNNNSKQGYKYENNNANKYY